MTTSTLCCCILVIFLTIFSVSNAIITPITANNTADNTATAKITNFAFHNVCKDTSTHASQDAQASFSFVIEPDFTPAKGWTRPVFVFDTTLTQNEIPNTSVDSQFRLQCKFNGIAIKKKWIRHHQIDFAKSDVENISPKLSVRWFIDIPQAIIPIGTKNQFTKIYAECMSFFPTDGVQNGTYFALEDLNNKNVSQFKFKCGKYGEYGKHGKHGKYDQDQDISNQCFHFEPQNYQNIVQNSAPKTIQSISQRLNQINSIPHTTPINSNDKYIITDVEAFELTAGAEFWHANATFNVKTLLSEPAQGSRTVLTFSNDRNTVTNNSLPLECWINHMTPILFDSQLGTYWIGEIPQQFASARYNIFCKYYTTRPSSQWFFKILDLPTTLNQLPICTDAIQCNRWYSHSDGPNPDQGCVHITYR
jgi:hypothetical protein